MRTIPKYYFRHDFSAMDDDKLIQVRMDLGWEGYGIFWGIIECLAQAGGSIPLARLPQLSYRLRVEEAIIKAVIHDYDLFVVTDSITNPRLLDFIEFDLLKRQKMAENAAKRSYKPESEMPNEIIVEATDLTPKRVIRRKAIDIETITLPFPTDEFKEMWDKWLSYRKEIKRPYKSPKSEQTVLNQLSKYTEAFALELINRSIANGWQGLVYDGTDKAFEDFANKGKSSNKKDRSEFNGLTAN
jgi:hypothetical protein